MGPVNPESARRLRHPDVVTRIARYYFCWGLDDGPARARATYAVLRRAQAAGVTEAAEQMNFAMDEAERWAQQLAAHAGQQDAELRRLNVVGRLKEALAEYPDCFLEPELPPEFLEMLLRPVPPITPQATPGVMRPRDLGKQPSPLRAGFWFRLARQARRAFRRRWTRRPPKGGTP